MRRPLLPAAVACVLVACGCGGHPSTSGRAGWTDARCREEAQRLTERADSLIRHYATEIYPADMSYLPFRDGLTLFRAGGCEPAVLGLALRGGLDAGDRRELVDLLPATIAATVGEALAAAG